MMVPHAHFGPGMHFGHLALAGKEPRDQVRKASIVTRTKCLLASLAKKDWDDILKAIDIKYTEQLQVFLKKIPIMKSLTRG
jgi:CRP-like cAMP-binding protein